MATFRTLAAFLLAKGRAPASVLGLFSAAGVLLLSTTYAYQGDSRHYLPPMPAYAASDLVIEVSTQSTETVAFVLRSREPGDDFVWNGTVTAGSPFFITINRNSNNENAAGLIGHTLASAGTPLDDYALVVEADAAISLGVAAVSSNSEDRFTSRGRSGLGTEFYAWSHFNTTGNATSTTNNDSGHFISIMAIEDNTEVTVEGDDLFFGFDLSSGSRSVTLDQYQSLVLLTESNLTVTGTRVTATRPISVISGDLHPAQDGSGAKDSAFDHLTPTSLAGTEFVVANLFDANSFGIEGSDDVPVGNRYVQLVAVADNSEVTQYDDSGNVVRVINFDNAGEVRVYHLPGNAGSGYFFRATSSTPGYLANEFLMFWNSSADTDAEMAGAQLPPLRSANSEGGFCSGSPRVGYSVPTGPSSFFVFIPSAELSSLEVDNGDGDGFRPYDSASLATANVTLIGAEDGPFDPIALVRYAGGFASAGAQVAFQSPRRMHVGLGSAPTAKAALGVFSDYDYNFRILDPQQNIPTTAYRLAVNSVNDLPQTESHCIRVDSVCSSTFQISAISTTLATVDNLAPDLGAPDSICLDFTPDPVVGAGTRSYPVPVTVTDNTGASRSVEVRFDYSFTDSGQPLSFTVESGTTTVDTLLSADADVAEWRIGDGDDAGLFSIDSSGLLRFINPPDFFNPQDASGNNVYEVTVEIETAAGPVFEQPVLVTVTEREPAFPVLISVDRSDPGSVVFTATGNAAAVDDASASILGGVSLLSLFAGAGFDASANLSVGGNLSPSGNAGAYNIGTNNFGTLGTSGLNIWGDGVGGGQSFTTSDPAFTGSTSGIDLSAAEFNDSGFIVIGDTFTLGGSGAVLGTWELAAIAPPSVSSVSPNSGVPAGGTSVLISGDDFNPGAIVTFGGSSCTNTQVLSASEISCETPPGAVGSVDVTVENLDGQSDTLIDGFIYIEPAPVIQSIVPDSGSRLGGFSIEISGEFFQAGAVASIGGSACSDVVVTVPDSIVCTVPAGTTGSVDVTVENPDGQSDTLIDGFTYIEPAPTVQSIVPASGTRLGGFTVVISGEHFQNGAMVSFGGVLCSDVVVSVPDSLSCTVPAGTVGSVDVTVENPDGQSDTLIDGFTYIDPAPTIQGIAPDSGSRLGGFTVVITGEHFQDGAVVSFGGSACSDEVVSVPDSLSCTVPAGTVGSVDVTVENPDGQSDTLIDGFTYIDPAPTIQGIAPDSGSRLGGFTVVIAGEHFQDGAVVNFGGSACSDVVVSVPDSLSCTVPAGTVGSVDVTVENPDGQSDTLIDGFTYIESAPVVQNITPDSGSRLGGFTVVITGEHFQDGAVVSFGGSACSDEVVSVPDSLSCTVPAGTVGSVDVTIENPDGQSDTLIDGFTYIDPAPTIQGIAPDSGSRLGGFTVVITGEHFQDGAVVNFGGSACSDVVVSVPDSLSCTVPAGTVGSVDVTVENPDGQGDTLPGGFVYEEPLPPSLPVPGLNLLGMLMLVLSMFILAIRSALVRKD
jgi:hypothetical protein